MVLSLRSRTLRLVIHCRKNVAKKLSIDRFRVYGTITNPLIIAKSRYLKDYDPEMNGTLEYPLTKQIVVGLNMTL